MASHICVCRVDQGSASSSFQYRIDLSILPSSDGVSLLHVNQSSVSKPFPLPKLHSLCSQMDKKNQFVRIYSRTLFTAQLLLLDGNMGMPDVRPSAGLSTMHVEWTSCGHPWWKWPRGSWSLLLTTQARVHVREDLHVQLMTHAWWHTRYVFHRARETAW